MSAPPEWFRRELGRAMAVDAWDSMPRWRRGSALWCLWWTGRPSRYYLRKLNQRGLHVLPVTWPAPNKTDQT